MLKIEKAKRTMSRLRLAIAGTSGSGKTYSALLIAKGLGNKVGVIDTEAGSASLYAHLLEFDVIKLHSFSPKLYIEAIQMMERAGYDVIVIDSLTHAWSGPGGILDQHDYHANNSKNMGNSYTAWRHVTPLHNQFVDTMIRSSAHIIGTMRCKSDYLQTENEHGKKTIKKVGLAPIQRDGLEYEFTVVFDLDGAHYATASKDRTTLFNDQRFIPSEETGHTFKTWFESADPVPVPFLLYHPASDKPYEMETSSAFIEAFSKGLASVKTKLLSAELSKASLQSLWDRNHLTIERLSPEECDKLQGVLMEQLSLFC